MKRTNFILDFKLNGTKNGRRSYSTKKCADYCARMLMYNITENNDRFTYTIKEQGKNDTLSVLSGYKNSKGQMIFFE